MTSAKMDFATQGHRYQWGGRSVLAMESGAGMVEVRPIEQAAPGFDWLGAGRMAHVADLVPQPMRYFHGEVPHRSRLTLPVRGEVG